MMQPKLCANVDNALGAKQVTACLCLGVGLLIDIFELIYSIVGIDLRSCQAGVAQQFFDGIDICAVIHEMGGKGMTKHVRAFFIYGGDEVQILFDDLIDA